MLSYFSFKRRHLLGQNDLERQEIKESFRDFLTLSRRKQGESQKRIEQNKDDCKEVHHPCAMEGLSSEGYC